MDSIEAPRYKKFKNEIYDREQMIKLLDLAKIQKWNYLLIWLLD